MYSITKEFHFEYAHKLNMDYESDCRNLHGHSARIIMTIWSDTLNKNGMIIDFMHFKKFRKFLDDNFDHAIILNPKDSMIDNIKKQKLKHYILSKSIDPTSEVMAKIVWEEFAKLLKENNAVWDKMEITFYETAKNCASYKEYNKRQKVEFML